MSRLDHFQNSLQQLLLDYSLALDTIRILVATDNHVGYAERDAIRSEDSHRTFHEIMCLAKERDVDMVLLAGDLFHDNKPSRKSLNSVMRSLRMNCYGEKPCELEMLSDGSENFTGAFDHVNYEDPDINVAIPVFSIHGNHDDPSGEGHLAALDILQTAGLINYYGQTPEADNIEIKPILLQKGMTKLALYGMSNVRDERLFRSFRDGKVKFFQPSLQRSDWFNIMSVHQNHHAYTETGYLPENFLPDFLDLVIWGHEHECIIDPTLNPEMDFHVVQPGSSVATSLMPGEAVPKKVAILSVTGREFAMEPIVLKTVRPFVMREIVLREEKEAIRLAKRTNSRIELTRFLEAIVNDMIAQAKAEWEQAQGNDRARQTSSVDAPLPLIRLRVEYTPPDGGSFDCENPQRFSNRFVGKVANLNDVVQFHRKKTGATRKTARGVEVPEDALQASQTLDTVKVEQLVRDFLAAQSLTILPQNSFGDAVSQFVDKDDKHAMEHFVEGNLASQVDVLMQMDQQDDEALQEAMGFQKSKLEELFAKGHVMTKNRKIKPRPEDWDSDLDGPWRTHDLARVHSDLEDADAPTSNRSTSHGKTTTNAPKRSTTTKKKPGAIRDKPTEISDDDEDRDVGLSRQGNTSGRTEMASDNDILMDEDEFPASDLESLQSHNLFVPETQPAKRQSTKKAAASKTSKGTTAPRKATASASASAPRTRRNGKTASASVSSKQTQLSFSQPSSRSQTSSTVNPTTRSRRQTFEPDDEEIDDDDDDFATPSSPARTTRSRR